MSTISIIVRKILFPKYNFFKLGTQLYQFFISTTDLFNSLLPFPGFSIILNFKLKQCVQLVVDIRADPLFNICFLFLMTLLLRFDLSL